MECILEGFVFVLKRADHVVYNFPIKQGRYSLFFFFWSLIFKNDIAWTSFHINTHAGASFSLTAAENSMLWFIVVGLTISLLVDIWSPPGDSYAASPASVHICQPLLCTDVESEPQGGDVKNKSNLLTKQISGEARLTIMILSCALRIELCHYSYYFFLMTKGN